ncbi:GNAT family N-acetyltransferase [Nocardioides bruguierae]|uniref:GNAT family N-acetyltransferase n=1 Tax=Nocardioides bruguierae TaxID=2945102 RepID=UPI0020227D0C|nr:GNAT family N-acetyltransferase [Nocardioides bruguierae]MCL8026873.1 GNAT family N-acetyltransferase [Nocardioides bruguierae]
MNSAARLQFEVQPDSQPDTQPHSQSDIVLDDLRTTADAEAFRRLNEEWITRIFALEDEDRRQLEHPVETLVQPGGAVLVARVGDEVVGCVGLAPARPGVVEVVKMVVSPQCQGRGLGRRLLVAALERARELGAHRVELESNRRLAPAVHLYQQLGFRHLSADEHVPGPYVRADVAMALDL